MLNEKCKAIGYTEPVSPSLLAAWKRPNHYISNTTYRGGYGSGFYMNFNISCSMSCDPKQYSVWFNKPKGGKGGASWDWYSTIPSSTEVNNLLRCPHDPLQNTAAEKGPLHFYGSTADSVHLQLHTDWEDAFRKLAAGGRELNLGALQFDKPMPDLND